MVPQMDAKSKKKKGVIKFSVIATVILGLHDLGSLNSLVIRIIRIFFYGSDPGVESPRPHISTFTSSYLAILVPGYHILVY